MVWLFLVLAIVLEVGAALSLRIATGGRKLFYIVVVVGYLGAFFFLTQVLALGLVSVSPTASGPPRALPLPRWPASSCSTNPSPGSWRSASR